MVTMVSWEFFGRLGSMVSNFIGTRLKNQMRYFFKEFQFDEPWSDGDVLHLKSMSPRIWKGNIDVGAHFTLVPCLEHTANNCWRHASAGSRPWSP